MKRCGIPLEHLGDYVEGRAEEETAKQIRTHLDAGCARCRENLAWLQKTTNAIREVHQIQVPQQMLDRAAALFRERYRAPVRPSLIARLVFDSHFNHSVLAGARGEENQARQLRFETDAYVIELSEEKVREGVWYLMGQALSRESGGAITPQNVSLTSAEGPSLLATQTRAVQPAEFHFPELPAGRYQLSLLLNDVELLVPDLTVGE